MDEFRSKTRVLLGLSRTGIRRRMTDETATFTPQESPIKSGQTDTLADSQAFAKYASNPGRQPPFPPLPFRTVDFSVPAYSGFLPSGSPQCDGTSRLHLRRPPADFSASVFSWLPGFRLNRSRRNVAAPSGATAPDTSSQLEVDSRLRWQDQPKRRIVIPPAARSRGRLLSRGTRGSSRRWRRRPRGGRSSR